MNRLDDALKSQELGRAIRERLAREHPSDTQFQYGPAVSFNQIGRIERYQGRLTEAIQSLERAARSSSR